MGRSTRLAGIAAAAVLLSACGMAVGSTAVAPGAAAAARPASRVRVTLSDQMRITLDKARVPAGEVTFAVTNTGKITHEMVVLKTDIAEDKIPSDPSEPDKVSEDASVGETGDMNAGTTKVITLDLLPGRYVLICNEPGHYAAGMHTSFEVE